MKNKTHQVKNTLRSEINILNVVCTADLKQEIDIKSFNQYKFLSSNLDLFSCGYVKDNTMIGKVSVFKNGKLISVGTKSIETAKNELEVAIKILKKYKFLKTHTITPKVRNIVSNTAFGTKINLNRLAKVLPRCMYEPDQFQSLVYRMHGSVVALIFSSGKIIFVGAKTIDELNSAFFDVQTRINKIITDSS